MYSRSICKGFGHFLLLQHIAIQLYVTAREKITESVMKADQARGYDILDLKLIAQNPSEDSELVSDRQVSGADSRDGQDG